MEGTEHRFGVPSPVPGARAAGGSLAGGTRAIGDRRAARAPVARRRAPWYGAAAMLALSLPLVSLSLAPSQLALLAAVAGVGALGAAIVARPVTLRPVGRVEVGLRCTTAAAVAGTVVGFLLLPLCESPKLPAIASAAISTVAALLIFSAVAVEVRRDDRAVSQVIFGADVPTMAPGDRYRVEPLPPLSAMFKRGTDLVVALLALPFAVPLIAIAAVLVVLDSRGGWRFMQSRVGRRGRPFRLAKLRTMAVDNDDSDHRAHMTALITGQPVPPGLYGKLAEDPRRTRVGVYLRRYSIDELPQLWNVIRGSMSIVGPRPPLPWEADLYTERMRERLAGKPGLTGLWQVEGRGTLSFEQMIELDLHYWEHWSPWLDLKILARTPKAVLSARNTG